jgi:exodeoxyribonuclease III
MKLVSLNICNGGGERMPAIERYLAATGADVIVLPEYRQHRPPHLDGFSIFDASTIAKNAVAVAVRGNAERVELLPADADRHRIVGIRYCGITIVGLYFAQNQAKASLFDYLITAPFKEPTLLVGDFNTGLALDAEGTPSHCGDLFERLSERFVDLWRKHNGSTAREFSWQSKSGNGFRIDHGFGLNIESRACRYDHTTRGTITDHSALIIDM